MTHISPALEELKRFHAIRLAQSKGGKKRWKGLSKAERSEIGRHARSFRKTKPSPSERSA